MNELCCVARNADVEFGSQAHEYQIAREDLLANDFAACQELLARRARHEQTGFAGRERNQAATVESPGRTAAKSIRLPEHAQRRGEKALPRRVIGGDRPVGFS